MDTNHCGNVGFKHRIQHVVDMTLLYNSKGCGFKSHPSYMPVIFFHRTCESTEYTVVTHIGVWDKPKLTNHCIP